MFKMLYEAAIEMAHQNCRAQPRLEMCSCADQAQQKLLCQAAAASSSMVSPMGFRVESMIGPMTSARNPLL